MLKKTLSEEELEFCELFYNPKCMIECLYPKGAMQTWNEEGECLTVRNYQIPLIQYDTVLADDDKLTDQENFQRRIDAGTLFVILGRKLGKSFIALIGNMILKLIYYSGREMTCAAYDEKHMGKIMDKMRSFFSSHDFFHQYKKSIKGSPEYTLETVNGNILYGVNETVKGKDPGANWWGHHTDINFQDEIQAESDAAYSKKIDAIGEMGCIEVLCGIPLVTKVSPLGKILKDRTKQKNILRFPQYISTFWNQKVREERERQYGGTNTVGYKVNVEAELIEGAEGAFDMQRVRDNYDPNKVIKAFEITKETYSQYFNILVLDSYVNAEKIFVFADIGDTAATEIGIAFKVNDKYHLVYNITAFRLSDKELSDMLKWIFKKVNADFIAVDCTIMGKPIYRQLSEALDIVKDGKVIKRVIWCAFNESVTVGYEKDDNGGVLLDANGRPVEKVENTLIFAVQRLREMFYEKQFVIPDNFIKFDEEMSSYLQLVSGNRVMFDSVGGADHTVQMMEVFAILIWQTEQLPALNINMKPKKTSLGIFSTEGD